MKTTKCTMCSAQFHHDDVLLNSKGLPTREYLKGNPYWALKYHMEEHHADSMFVCGRQSITSAPEAFWEADGTCSYCGSLSPTRLFECIEQGVKITPTDKGYKVYVDVPNINPVDRVISSTWAVERPGDNYIE